MDRKIRVEKYLAMSFSDFFPSPKPPITAWLAISDTRMGCPLVFSTSTIAAMPVEMIH
jgi:hypothetical protein